MMGSKNRVALPRPRRHDRTRRENTVTRSGKEAPPASGGMARRTPGGHDRPVKEEMEIDFQATQPSAEGGPMRARHDPRLLDAAVEEARWRELPPPPPAASQRPALPPAPREHPQDRPRRRVRWWLLALLVAMLAAGALQLLPSESPPCGDRMFIPPTGNQPSCVDPALLQQSSK